MTSPEVLPARKTVVVTGAAGALGAAICSRLIRDNFDIIAIDRIAVDGTGVVDLCREAEIVAFAQRVRNQGRTIHGLVNVAGRPGEGAIETMPADDWYEVFAINVRVPMLMIKHLVSLMVEGSSIINFGSIASFKGFAERTSYCAAKAAVLGLTRAAAVELAPRGIRVNALCPGTIDTPWINRLIAQSPDPVQARRAMTGRAPMNRMGTPEEIANAVAHLIGDGAAFITGTAIQVDGGASAV